MPSQLALLLTIGFVLYLLRRVSRESPAVSKDLWLPVIWIFLIASRFPSGWLTTFDINIISGGSMEEGSPLDAVCFLILILLGAVALSRRNFTLSSLLRENTALTIFFVYCILAIFWSDFPFVAIKRWIKTLAHPIMALIILSDPDPKLAFRIVMKRCAFIMLPFSVLCIKYFPQIGRGFDIWSGQATNMGITLNKNELGYGCFIFGMFFVWNFLVSKQWTDKKARRNEMALSMGFLVMILWLLYMARSATSFMTLTIGSAVIVGLGYSIVSKRYFGTQVLASIFLAVILELSFGIYAMVLNMLGRDASLTDRTQVWADALALVDSPLIGAGFESFWLGERLEKMWAKWWWQPNQAHSGYIETYLNLGIIGLILLFVLMIATFRKITARFPSDFLFARYRMGLLFATITYNYTEATFKATSVVWTLFYIISIDMPNPTASAPNSKTHMGGYR